MSKKYKLAAQPRDRAGKGIARALRRDGRIPAVIYGDNKEPVLISLPAKETEIEYHKGHMFTNLCDVKLEGGDTHHVLARDVQTHPVTDRVEHIDFLRVTSKTKIAVNVPAHFINEEECPGLRKGGILNIVRHEIELVCSATAIPESVEFDLAGVEVGDSIKMSNAKLPSGVHPAIGDRDFTIATMAAPKVAVDEDEETAEGEAAEGEAEAEEGAEAAEGDAPAEEASE
ncbi:MAG: 50S ribosomal protein L25/general stress protein Ctc [Pseudobdellovibrionaceae bacterium]